MTRWRCAFARVAAVGIILLVAGCSSGPKDQDLATTIKGQMFSSPALRAANLDVTVKDGEATLTGDVPDDATRYQAYKLATDTPGVKHVVDKMMVQSAQAAALPSPPADVAPAAPPAPSAKHESKKERREELKLARREAKEVPPVEQAQATPPPPPPAQPDPQPQAVGAPTPPLPQPPPPQPTRVEIPAGTPVHVQMIDSIDSSKNHAGDLFHASLQAALMVDNQIVVPAGVDVYVRLVTAQSAGHIAGQSELALELAHLEFQGKEYSLVSTQYKQTAASRSTRSKETIGGGAVVGALLGAVIGRGKGAVIGGAAGAGAGTAAEEATQAKQVKIASETKLDFSLSQPLDVSYVPGGNPNR